MSSSARPAIAALYRYPIKGLSSEPLASVTVAPGATLPFDRAYAIENGPSRFDPAAPKHLPKIAFLMLMRNERLASLQTRFDETTATLTVRKDGGVVAEGCLETEEGRRAIEAFFDAFAADELRGPTKVLRAPGHAFTDTSAKCLSLINLASLRDLEKHIGGDVHPLRFRANIYVDGLPAWAELDWVEKRFAAGSVVLQAFARIDRCAATNVNPDTAERDRTIPLSLQQAYGHPDCGIYLRVVTGGELTVGQEMLPVD